MTSPNFDPSINSVKKVRSTTIGKKTLNLENFLQDCKNPNLSSHSLLNDIGYIDKSKDSLQQRNELHNFLHVEQITHINELSYRINIYGILWENFLKRDPHALSSLNIFYKTNDFKFHKRFPMKNEWKNMYDTRLLNNSDHLEYELVKKYIEFDMYSISKKLIIDLKLSSVTAIDYKDLAYAFYFPDHELYFFFFSPLYRNDSFDQLFKNRINLLTEKMNLYLKPTYKLDVNDILKRVKYITRSDLSNFPDLTEELSILIKYLPQPPYICKYCNIPKKYTTFGNLSQHILRDHKHVTEKCPECHDQIPYGYLMYHINSKHKRKTKECPECHELILFNGLSMHIRRKHRPKKKVKCDYPGCNKWYQSDKLDGHKKRDHEHVTQECPECHDLVPYDRLYQHIQRKHRPKKKVRCDYPNCNKRYPPDKLGRHKKRDHEHVTEECPECHDFVPYGALSNHIQRKHRPEKKVKCNYPNCNKRYPPDKLGRHKKRDHEHVTQECPECHDFVPYGALSNHIQRKHRPKTKVKCNYPDCNKIYSSSELRNHKKRDHEHITQECPECHDLIPYGLMSNHKRTKHKK